MFVNDVNTNNNMKSALYFYSILLYPSYWNGDGNAGNFALDTIHITNHITNHIRTQVYQSGCAHSRIMKYKQKGIAHFLTIQIIMVLYVQEVVTLFM